MKEYNRIFIVFLIILIYPILSQNKSDQNTETNYVELAINIFKKLEEECFVELEGLFHERIKFEKDKRYPWLMDSIGKGINDIGDEIECLYSLQNTTFFLVNFYQLDLSKILDNDHEEEYSLEELENMFKDFNIKKFDNINITKFKK